MRLITADGPLLNQILRETHTVWDQGLTHSGYTTLNAVQQRTAWGRQHLARVALVDEADRLLSTAKRYRFSAQVNGRKVPICGIGAVFTSSSKRGRGYASALIERLVDEERRNGAAFAMLFSEIAPAFYERLGFHVVRLDEWSISVDRKSGGSPAMLVRAGDERDLPAIAAMHDVRAGGTPFRLHRDPALIQHMLTRKRLIAGLGPVGRRQIEFFVAEEGASAVAYVMLFVNQFGWTLDEAGDRDPAAARLGAILQVLLAREPSREPPLIRTWWPRSFAVPPQLSLTDRSDPRDVMMIRALGDIPAPTSADDVFYWRSDEF
jgi:GNAT superfamily N-acetyltransferase